MMIHNISGLLQEIEQEYLVIEVGGLGFQVFVPSTVLGSLNVGDHVFLFTYFSVKEDSLNLYGFENREDRSLFTSLLSVSGIGPKLALSVLSTLSHPMIYSAVKNDQYEVFVQVPGIGKKTAQRIILQLQDQLPLTVDFPSETADLDMELVSALRSLGYNLVEAQSAVQSIPADTPDNLETRLKTALQYFQ
jgi:Holliday junction DNA helicase RuvA